MQVHITVLYLLFVAVVSAQNCHVDGHEYRHKEIFIDEACEQCECIFGDVVCTYMVCINPRCVDYITRNCCWHCPNGYNCRVPGGEEIVKGDGKFHMVNETTMCMCPTIEEYSEASVVPTLQSAVCHKVPKRTDPKPNRLKTNCQYKGNTYRNKEIFTTDDCHKCECIGGTVVCKRMECINPRCVDYKANDCCWECPNGKNCKAPNGKIIPDDGNYHSVNTTTVCICPEITVELPALSKVYHMGAVCKGQWEVSKSQPPSTTELNEDDSQKNPTTPVPFYLTTCVPCPDPMKLPAKGIVFKILSSWILQLAQSLEKMDDCIF